MPTVDRVLRSQPDAPWLPPEGRADVVLSGRGASLPDPTCLVRLLVSRGREIHVVDREDGRGPDLPGRRVLAAGPESALAALLDDVLGSGKRARSSASGTGGRCGTAPRRPTTDA